MSPTSSSPTAGEAGDDDVEETGDGTNDGLQDGGNAIDNGHEAGTDGAEDGFNLYESPLATNHSHKRREYRHTHDTTAPIVKLLRFAT
jgi:hypothetical protein